MVQNDEESSRERVKPGQIKVDDPDEVVSITKGIVFKLMHLTYDDDDYSGSAWAKGSGSAVGDVITFIELACIVKEVQLHFVGHFIGLLT
ncbi:hypothetical protein DGG96_17345 [Legionella qingyii]|uniref:Uncharacterized protein n=1 Tax=Legionella qingyii TaxID=2184757 RepID=A0A317TXR9_9GAMM|nr:hypothetical protein [Legionella qingyii]PWY54373.1 hypothetical protein DGG96_17345 [Legionella qingyii]